MYNSLLGYTIEKFVAVWPLQVDVKKNEDFW
jgi:hypothetical protein